MRIKPTPNVEARFWSKVRVGPGCWDWGAGCSAKGYGVFHLSRRIQVRAHRMAWVFNYGAIPEGLFACHRCDNPKCVRPDHLFLGTPLDNMRDMWAKGRGACGLRQGAYTHPESVRKGLQMSWAILTPEIVMASREAFANGTRITELAAMYQVPYGCLYRAVSRRTWKHIP